MARNIVDFIQNFDGGAKPNLYEIAIFPGNGQINRSRMGAKNKPSIAFQAKGAQLPESTVGEIIVPYQGRQVKVPGDRVYQDWTITVISDEAMNLRKEFEKWNKLLNDHVRNTPDGDSLEGPGIYEWTMNTTAEVHSLSRTGKTSHSYVLYGVFPKEVSSVDLAYDNNDTAMEFTVTLTYSYHTPLAIGGTVTEPPDAGAASSGIKDFGLNS